MSKPVPANKALYEKVKKEAKAKFEHWPSAYGSQWLVKTYTRTRRNLHRGSKERNFWSYQMEQRKMDRRTW